MSTVSEVQKWIIERRADLGFLRLTTLPQLETLFLSQDELMPVLPEDHPLANRDIFPMDVLCREPFLLLEIDKNIVVSDIFKRNHLKPDIRFITWNDYAILSMV
ncbi:MAG: LysR family transcriptional regulator substrate-binding protein [Dorea sp.]|nr:LysR family transcriptional regulator substrate-binding protein [Dorea sp.]